MSEKLVDGVDHDTWMATAELPFAGRIEPVHMGGPVLRDDRPLLQAVLDYEQQLLRKKEHLAEDVPQAVQAAEFAEFLLGNAQQRTSDFEDDIDEQARTTGLLQRFGLRMMAMPAQKRLREQEHAAERHWHDNLHTVEARRAEASVVERELDAVAAWLDTRVDPDSKEGIRRRWQIEAADRSAEVPGWVIRYDTPEEFVRDRPSRLVFERNGTLVLEGSDFGFGWRRDPEDTHHAPRKGHWRVSRIRSDGEVYAELTTNSRTPAVWSFGPRYPDEATAAEAIEPLFARIEERNSLLLLADTLARAPAR